MNHLIWRLKTFILFLLSICPLLSVLDLYEHSGMVLLSVSLKLLVLNWISPSCSSSIFLLFFFFLPVLVSEAVLRGTAPCCLSPAPLFHVCLHLCRALPRLPVSVPFRLAFRMRFCSHGPLRVCLTASSFCTCKGCVFALGQGG